MKLWPARPREELKKKDCFQSSNENVRERYLGNVGSFWAIPSAESNVRERSRYIEQSFGSGTFFNAILGCFCYIFNLQRAFSFNMNHYELDWFKYYYYICTQVMIEVDLKT